MVDDELETRLGALEDREAIIDLKSAFIQAVNGGWNSTLPDATAVVALFTADGVWDGGSYGRATGHEEIHALLAGSLEHLAMSFRLALNPVIALHGDRAAARWNVVTYANEDGANVVHGGVYHDELLRTADGWRFSSLRYEPAFSGALDDLTIARTPVADPA